MGNNKSKLEQIIKEGVKATKQAFSNVKTTANIGSKKISLYMLKNQLKEKLAELGAITYRMIEENKTINKKNKTIEVICTHIQRIKNEIRQAEQTIDNLKQNKE